MTVKHHLRVILQTGPFTPPDSLLRDLETIDGIQINVQRLGASFRGGGVATFITVTTNNASIAPLAEAVYQHTKRLKTRGGDDLFILVGGEISTNEEEVSFREVRSQRQLSLKDKSQDEIRGLLLEGDVG
jgi:hypothetical protein